MVWAYRRLSIGAVITCLLFVNMAGMEFVIPASKEELRRDEGKGVYVVRQTFDNDELPMVLEGMLSRTLLVTPTRVLY